jgi:hypothetical protein
MSDLSANATPVAATPAVSTSVAATPDAATPDATPSRPTISSLTAFAAPAKSTLSQGISMLVFVVSMQVNMKVPANVMAVQTAFAIMVSIVYSACLYLALLVPAEGSTGSSATVCYYPAEDPLQNADNPLMSLLSGASGKKATKWEKTTLGALERQLAERKKTSAMSFIMPAMLSWFMNIHYLACSQVSAQQKQLSLPPTMHIHSTALPPASTPPDRLCLAP